MGRALIVIQGEYEREKAQHWIAKAPKGTRIEFKSSKRSLPQNAFMHALLTEFMIHERSQGGHDYDLDTWKLIFLHAWGKEVRFLPSLDGKGFVPVPQSSSDLTKDEMTDFIEFIIAQGAMRGIEFKGLKESK